MGQTNSIAEKGVETFNFTTRISQHFIKALSGLIDKPKQLQALTSSVFIHEEPKKPEIRHLSKKRHLDLNSEACIRSLEKYFPGNMSGQ